MIEKIVHIHLKINKIFILKIIVFLRIFIMLKNEGKFQKLLSGGEYIINLYLLSSLIN